MEGKMTDQDDGKRTLQSYKDLEIFQIAHALLVRVHQMTLDKLPKFEMFEEGSQIRRSSKSIKINIVEGFGRKRYPADYISTSPTLFPSAMKLKNI
jgi:hypothetical protein